MWLWLLDTLETCYRLCRCGINRSAGREIKVVVEMIVSVVGNVCIDREGRIATHCVAERNGTKRENRK